MTPDANRKPCKYCEDRLYGACLERFEVIATSDYYWSELKRCTICGTLWDIETRIGGITSPEAALERYPELRLEDLA